MAPPQPLPMQPRLPRLGPTRPYTPIRLWWDLFATNFSRPVWEPYPWWVILVWWALPVAWPAALILTLCGVRIDA